MDVPARWADLVRRPEPEVPLDEAALLISAAADPGLDVDAQMARLDDLGARVGSDEPDAVSRLLFGELGLRGDRDGYYQPVNSYLDRVLDRGLGIPITLAVLLVEVGRRAGVVLEAVGMPGHFLVRDPARPGTLIDPSA
ncbi:MAG: transglutaminase-like domain-containing protein, partial [Actinomycetota bacterium]|nr:transglutaminase-like domain-containing protein [Actinomycetota bacterium]